MRNPILKLKDPYMEGPAVARLQELIQPPQQNLLVDGIFGPITHVRVKRLQSLAGLTVDGIVGPRTWGSIDAPRIIDLSEGHHKPPALASDKHPYRTWNVIHGVTVHQTGCRLSPHHDRWGRVNAHILMPRSGGLVLLNDPTMVIWHAHGLSMNTIGVEFEGNFEGIQYLLKTLWGHEDGAVPDYLTKEQMASIPLLIKHLTEEFDAHDQPLSMVQAHRQSSESRPHDPGSQIWQSFALPLRKEIGVKHGLITTWGSGQTIPKGWS